jgi:agmatinase
VRTFARCPHVRDTGGVDVAVVGIPFDTGTSNRPGEGFGPEAGQEVRAAFSSTNVCRPSAVRWLRGNR